MRLTTKQNGQPVNELHAESGTLYLGRHAYNQIVLADSRVSRQHAMVYSTEDGRWMIEDLDSANKTYVNGTPITRVCLQSGDRVSIGHFVIEVDLENDSPPAVSPSAETHTEGLKKARRLCRHLDPDHGPDITLPAGRLNDFIEAAASIRTADGIHNIHNALLMIMESHFNAARCWCALRQQSGGLMAVQGGRTINGQDFVMSNDAIYQPIKQSLDEGVFQLLLDVQDEEHQTTLSSALIAPLIFRNGCLGVLYLDNEHNQTRYTFSDLDYLVLLALHTAAALVDVESSLTL